MPAGVSFNAARRRAAITAGLLWLCAACNPSLPEADSPGARLYAERCNGPCHRLYAPGSLKFEMWKIQVQRMQADMVQGGLPPLTLEEMDLMLDYLRRNSG